MVPSTGSLDGTGSPGSLGASAAANTISSGSPDTVPRRMPRSSAIHSSFRVRSPRPARARSDSAANSPGLSSGRANPSCSWRAPSSGRAARRSAASFLSAAFALAEHGPKPSVALKIVARGDPEVEIGGLGPTIPLGFGSPLAAARDPVAGRRRCYRDRVLG